MKANSNNINNNKSNKTKSIIALTSLIIVLSIVNITLLTGTIFGININTNTNASALSYSTSEDVSFTFAPTLSIGLSTDSLTIDNLVPGTTNDSNTVTVTVSSNTPYGYVLSAGVGSTVSTDPYYDTSDLVHDNSTTQVPTTNKFSSISTTASLPTLDTDNTWGYSTSTDGGTSWSTYSGLSHTETKPLLDISDPATPSTIDFKIAARSASTQASGTYNNIITFYAVGKPQTFYMQEPEVIKTKLKNIGDELQAIDQRDGKEYWIRKMADGKIWMTQNLDLELDSTKTYTPTDTDITANWQPIRSTIEVSGTRVSGWNNDDYTPYSASPHRPGRSAHNHVGSYYNWSAAVASNNTNTTALKTSYKNAPNSICPAGWRLPTGQNRANTAASREWNALLVAEGIMTNPEGEGYAVSGFNNIRKSPLWLVQAGNVRSGSLNDAGTFGEYWSSTAYSSTSAYSLRFYSGGVRPAISDYRNCGYSVRCLIK